MSLSVIKYRSNRWKRALRGRRGPLGATHLRGLGEEAPVTGNSGLKRLREGCPGKLRTGQFEQVPRVSGRWQRALRGRRGASGRHALAWIGRRHGSSPAETGRRASLPPSDPHDEDTACAGKGRGAVRAASWYRCLGVKITELEHTGKEHEARAGLPRATSQDYGKV